MSGVIVGLDTATSATSVAVLAGTELERRDDPSRAERPRHAETLLPLLEQSLAQAQVGWGDVARLCVGIGPGGFTGLRLGISTARAISQGHDLPLVGVSSLEALARGGQTDPGGTVLAMIDARRGEVFAAAYRGDRATLEPVAIAPPGADRAPGCGARPDTGRG
jgi:tRNA threonylcarbamoyladenosine biosynthesis protein TsaB